MGLGCRTCKSTLAAERSGWLVAGPRSGSGVRARARAAFKDNRGKKKPCCLLSSEDVTSPSFAFPSADLALTFSPLAARFALVCVCAPPRLHTRSSSLDEREDDVMLYEARGSLSVKFSFLPRASCCQRDF